MTFSPKNFLYDWFTQKVDKCESCVLHKERTNVVIGEGDINANLMIIGEAPGKEEDEQGKPFVGKAGQQLDKILDYVKIPRESVYITNSVLCRPPDNRTPLYTEEILTCNKRLLTQIFIIRPKVIACLGKCAVQALFGDFEGPLKGFLGRDLNFELCGEKIPVVASYHPSYILRKSQDKEVKMRAAKHWDRIKEILDESNMGS